MRVGTNFRTTQGEGERETAPIGAVSSFGVPAAERGDQPLSPSGTSSSSSASQTAALPSEGARQSPRGDKEPPEEILGPFGRAERLNWLTWKKRRRKTRSHALISESE